MGRPREVVNQRTVQVVWFPEPVPYETAYQLQRERRELVEKDDALDTLFLLEHPPTITLGRESDEGHLLKSRDALASIGIDVVEADRGGDVTYHGPGQLVAYPIVNLAHWKQSISWYLRALEDVLIEVLDGYGLRGERLEGFTGVWVGGAKVAAIGVGIRNWVTYHGIALNVDPNMDHWDLIVPCGIPDKPVTSLRNLLDEPPTFQQAMVDYERAFRHRFIDVGTELLEE